MNAYHDLVLKLAIFLFVSQFHSVPTRVPLLVSIRAQRTAQLLFVGTARKARNEQFLERDAKKESDFRLPSPWTSGASMDAELRWPWTRAIPLSRLALAHGWGKKIVEMPRHDGPSCQDLCHNTDRPGKLWRRRFTSYCGNSGATIACPLSFSSLLGCSNQTLSVLDPSLAAVRVAFCHASISQERERRRRGRQQQAPSSKVQPSFAAVKDSRDPSAMYFILGVEVEWVVCIDKWNWFHKKVVFAPFSGPEVVEVVEKTAEPFLSLYCWRLNWWIMYKFWRRPSFSCSPWKQVGSKPRSSIR